MKRKLDLRTGIPVWQAYRTPGVPFKPLTRDAKADVLVVGMGISGAMIAEALAADGMSVIAIDRRGPLKGSTAATTALVQFEIDQPLSLLSAKIGKDRAERAWRRSRLAVVQPQGAHCRTGDPDADMANAARFISPATCSIPARFERRESGGAAAGLHAIYLTARRAERAFRHRPRGGAAQRRQSRARPAEARSRPVSQGGGAGARFYAPVEATGFDDSKRQGDGRDQRAGRSITAGAVVLATGYELTDVVPAGGHRIISTWAIATRPQPRALWPHEAFIWEASDPYLYLRVDRRRARDLRRRGRGIYRRGTARRAHPREVAAHREEARQAVPDSSTRSPNSPGPVRSGPRSSGLPIIGRAAAPPEHLRRDGIWRQRHHLFADRFRDRPLGDGRKAGSRRRPLRIPEMIGDSLPSRAAMPIVTATIHA